MTDLIYGEPIWLRGSLSRGFVVVQLATTGTIFRVARAFSENAIYTTTLTDAITIAEQLWGQIQ
jgi:hypothetical protein